MQRSSQYLFLPQRLEICLMGGIGPTENLLVMYFHENISLVSKFVGRFFYPQFDPCFFIEKIYIQFKTI